jgi:acetolactate synthase-1/2/3 large subunit
MQSAQSTPAQEAELSQSNEAISLLGEVPSTGAQAVVAALVKANVELIFGYPGGAIMPIYDAIYVARNQIRHVLVRHEQGAVHAAQGYARTALSPSVCMGTSGPGATNLLTGLADAMMDSTPVLAITGQVPSTVLGTDAFQESDIIGMSLPVTKWSFQVTDPNEVEWAILEGLRIAQDGRPGPVLIDITKDAQMGCVEINQRKQITELPGTSPRPTSDGTTPLDINFAVERAATLLNEAHTPLIFVGHGILISGAEQALLALLENSGIPVASTLLGLSALPTNHPLNVGMLGMHGNYGPNMLTNCADVILAVGMRFDDRVTGRLDGYAPDTRFIHIDIDAAELGKTVPTEIGIASDARPILEALAKRVNKHDHSTWLARFRSYDEEEHAVITAPAMSRPDEEMSMVQVVSALSSATHGDAIIVSDVGQHQMHAARHYDFRQPNSHITSGGLGTMGFALPAAIGAASAGPGRPVIAIAGDGGFQMNIQELGTVMQEQVPVKIVILNNDYLGMVRQWQQLFFDARYSQVNMQNPDFVAICGGYGIPAQRVSNRGELANAITTMLETPGPYLLDVAVCQEENVFPMIPAGDRVDQIRLT